MTAAFIITFLTFFLPVQDTLSSSTVTALKEAVPVKMVASAVTSIREETLKDNGVYRQNSISAMVPGLHIPEYGASLTSTIYLRGLGSRMDNPVMGLYVDGIPVIEKNAFDFDWEGVRNVFLLRGPQGTLYGRNAMGGVLAIKTLSPSDAAPLVAYIEYGLYNTLRAGASAAFGNNVVSATFRHTDGYFQNEYKDAACDPYNGLGLRWKWEKASDERLFLTNTLSVNLSSEGGFAYGQYKDGVQYPVSYNDEGSYRRLSAIEGFKLRRSGDAVTLDATASAQLLLDDMKMDQDFTQIPVFTLEQKQRVGIGLIEIIARKSDSNAAWQPQTGFFAFYRHNHMSAPVTFKRAGIESLMLDNANKNIPEDIGYLCISDQTMPVNSDFMIGSWNAALFHESVLRSGPWLLTAGLRLDYEGAQMDYDCLAQLHYQFVPTMATDKALDVPYHGRENHSCFELLPKLSALYEASSYLKLFATVSKGYRSGGFNTQIFSDILQGQTMNALMRDLGVYLDKSMASVLADATEYDPEQAWNYELGARFNKGRFNTQLSAYYLQVRNQQLTVFPPGKSTGRMMTNAGRSRSLGLEAEASWTAERFHTRAAWSFCDARFEDYNDGNNDYSGNHIPYVPSHTLYLSAGYRQPMQWATLRLEANARGTGPIWWNESNTLRETFSLRIDVIAALCFPYWDLYLRGENLSGNAAKVFYFKSVGNEFFSLARPRNILIGIRIKL